MTQRSRVGAYTKSVALMTRADFAAVIALPDGDESG